MLIGAVVADNSNYHILNQKKPKEILRFYFYFKIVHLNFLKNLLTGFWSLGDLSTLYFWE